MEPWTGCLTTCRPIASFAATLLAPWAPSTQVTHATTAARAAGWCAARARPTGPLWASATTAKRRGSWIARAKWWARRRLRTGRRAQGCVMTATGRRRTSGTACPPARRRGSGGSSHRMRSGQTGQRPTARQAAAGRAPRHFLRRRALVARAAGVGVGVGVGVA